MIIIDKPRMRFLLAGRILTIEITNPDHYRKGRSYSVGVRHNKQVCRGEILHVDPDAGTIQIRQQILQAEPNLLARHSQYGYTSNPAQAMFGEPEAVIPDDIERLTRRDRERREQDASKQARSLGIRIKDAARRCDIATCGSLGAELVELHAHFAVLSGTV